jgi:16S rRNA (adenine(1408)-N(1))-methyltransferase
MLVLAGRQTQELGRDDLVARAARAERVVADLGTGDGRFAYRLAREHPAWLVVGVDPSADAMAEVSRRAARKPARGGLENVLFVVGTGEALPAELDGLCDEVLAILPWGRLMRDLLLGEPETLAGIARIAAPGAGIRLILNTEIFEKPVPLDVRELPEATPEYAREQLVPRYAEHGIALEELRYLTQDEVRALHSTWSRRLAHAREPRFLLLAGRSTPR